MIISLIAAMGRNRVIGADNKMMWRLPKEWAYFKEKTLNHCIVTGRKNFEAQGRALPRRTNIVVTRDQSYIAEGAVVVHSLEEAISFAKSQEEVELFICGGGEVYKQMLPKADRIYLTVVDFEEEGEVYFPKFNEELFEKQLVMAQEKNEDNALAWNAYLFTRK